MDGQARRAASCSRPAAPFANLGRDLIVSSGGRRARFMPPAFDRGRAGLARAGSGALRSRHGSVRCPVRISPVTSGVVVDSSMYRCEFSASGCFQYRAVLRGVMTSATRHGNTVWTLSWSTLSAHLRGWLDLYMFCGASLAATYLLLRALRSASTTRYVSIQSNI